MWDKTMENKWQFNSEMGFRRLKTIRIFYNFKIPFQIISCSCYVLLIIIVSWGYFNCKCQLIIFNQGYVTRTWWPGNHSFRFQLDASVIGEKYVSPLQFPPTNFVSDENTNKTLKFWTHLHCPANQFPERANTPNDVS